MSIDPQIDPRSVWQSMRVETVAISAAEMRARAKAFAWKIRRRNRIEYIACGITAAIFGLYAFIPRGTPLWPIANLMLMAGMILIAFNLHRRAHAVDPPAAASASALIDFQIRELTRHRDAARTVWFWYVLPAVPGVILWYIAMWMSATNPDRLAWALGGVAVVTALVFALVIVLNLRGAARLQKMIDELDSFREKQ
jgi:hypothetical protein